MNRVSLALQTYTRALHFETNLNPNKLLLQIFFLRPRFGKTLQFLDFFIFPRFCEAIKKDILGMHPTMICQVWSQQQQVLKGV